MIHRSDHGIIETPIGKEILKEREKSDYRHLDSRSNHNHVDSTW